MTPTHRRLRPRWLLIASIVFGLFVLSDMALFGWLIIHTLSERELERVLIETREEAEPLAHQIEQQAERVGRDLYVAVTVAQETQTFFDSKLTQRALVRRVEIRDRDGRVVYRDERTQREPPESVVVPRLETSEAPRGEDFKPLVDADLETVKLQIGDMGELVIGLSREGLQQQIGTLRRDLIRQISLIGGLTLVLLAAAYGAVWALFRRSRRLEEQANEAERLAYIGTLASGLAHEIRNPLNSLNLNMQMLAEEAEQRGAGGSSRRLVSITRSEISRLERLVTDFLSYAKPRPLELEEIPAVELLGRLAEVLEGELRSRRARLSIEDRSEGARVRVDRAQIGQLLLNLAQNSLAAATEIGRIPELRLSAERRAQQVVLEIADNGGGIAETDREKIFDLFFSTRKGGTGLGLAIVERIARAHGTHVEVEVHPGEGTSMRLALPAVG